MHRSRYSNLVFSIILKSGKFEAQFEKLGIHHYRNLPVIFCERAFKPRAVESLSKIGSALRSE